MLPFCPWPKPWFTKGNSPGTSQSSSTPQSHGRAAQRRVGRPDLLGSHVARTAAPESEAGYDEYTSVPNKVS
jgi:hypothetical protein